MGTGKVKSTPASLWPNPVMFIHNKILFKLTFLLQINGFNSTFFPLEDPG